ncbi:sulfur carrier protein ThiS [Zhihengliuella halotolerans]|uniref:Sulfur carrier protein n=1 Tax=Zhihengliuella halotolerans TaxID=370736 RepID=A0A4Q8AEM2_9MICC|nr:sulfur carrier protein ThiS [Zhihengliuella halotolerans]RZU62737.1 sulfur carrier protein [Zhihengliuella halotolerans]
MTHPAQATDVAFTLNGAERIVRGETSLRDVVVQETGKSIGDDGRLADGRGTGVAAALDGEVVPRSAWAATPIAAGAVVELVTATQGG